MPDTVVANPGSSGAIFATDIVTSSVNYVLQKIAYGSTGVANLVSTALPFPVASASSGFVQISGNPTVIVASSAGLTQTVTVVSASSGLVQALQSGTWTVQTTAGTAIATSSAIGLPEYLAVTPTSSVAGASIAPVTSSAGLLASLSSGTVSLSSQITVTAQQGTPTNWTVVSASSGLVQISGVPTVTATAGTNPWSSAPGFNIPVVTVSSGLVQVSGTVTVLSASSGLVQISGNPTIIVGTTAGTAIATSSSIGLPEYLAVTPTSSNAGAGIGPVTSSAGVLASLSSGTVTISGTVTVLSASSGLVQISGIPTVVVTTSAGVWSGAPFIQVQGSSGVGAIVTSSGALSVTISTAAGAGSTAVNIVGTSGATAPATSSGGLSVTIVSGAGAGSTAVNIVGTSSAIAPATSSGGLLVTATQGTNPWSSAPGFNVPVVTVSSGLVQISGTPTVTATAGTNPWSSAPGFNIPVVSVSSGLVQISGTPAVTIQGSSGGTVLVTTSGAMSVTISTAAGAGSTSVNIVATAGFAPVTSSAGLSVVLTSGTVTATAGTNPWSSAPGFNLPVVTVSSGLLQAYQVGTWTIQTTAGTAIATSSAIGLPEYLAVTPTSSVAGAAIGPVTSSAGLLASLSSGTVTLSSVHTVTATGPVTITSGTVTLSSNITVISASSGLVQISGIPTVIVASSAGLTQTVTVLSASSGLVQISGTVTVLSASSGFVQTFVAPPVVTSNIVSTYFYSTGGAASVNVRGSASNLLGYSYFNSTAAIRSIKIYNTSSAPTIGSTTAVLLTLMAPGSTGGGGANVMLPLPGLFASAGIGFTMTAGVGATDTGAPGSNDLVLDLYFV